MPNPKTLTNPRGAGRQRKGDAEHVQMRLSPLAIAWLRRQPKKAAAVAALVEAEAARDDDRVTAKTLGTAVLFKILGLF